MSFEKKEFIIFTLFSLIIPCIIAILDKIGAKQTIINLGTGGAVFVTKEK